MVARFYLKRFYGRSVASEDFYDVMKEGDWHGEDFKGVRPVYYQHPHLTAMLFYIAGIVNIKQVIAAYSFHKTPVRCLAEIQYTIRFTVITSSMGQRLTYQCSNVRLCKKTQKIAVFSSDPYLLLSQEWMQKEHRLAIQKFNHTIDTSFALSRHKRIIYVDRSTIGGILNFIIELIRLHKHINEDLVRSFICKCMEINADVFARLTFTADVNMTVDIPIEHIEPIINILCYRNFFYLLMHYQEFFPNSMPRIVIHDLDVICL